jgi:PKD domain.
MSFKSIFSLLFLSAAASPTLAETPIGCPAFTEGDANELRIYSGPYTNPINNNRYLTDTYRFKAKESAWDGGWGSSLTWYLAKETYKYSGNYQYVYTRDDEFDFDGTDNQLIPVEKSGNYCAVIESSGYCNNRCFIAQEKPTASASHEDIPQGFIEYNTQIQFYGSGEIDAYALNDEVEYRWSFGDGQTSSKKSPSHVYSKAGTYFPRLKTYDGKFESKSVTAGKVWVRGPAQPPRTIKYEYGQCSSYTRLGSLEWEKSGTGFVIQKSVGSSWLTIATPTVNYISYNTSQTGNQKFRIKAKDPEYGSDSVWKSFNFSVPGCSGGDPVHPL